ncbi:MAG: carbon-nitrogen hydrolase family protein [Solirubrobacterales bacterium]|nr:carbon-nitrogen hydrolase family protein [Solirubrobacterales bacterium]
MPGVGDVEAAVRVAQRTIADARRRGAKLIVFPEATIGGYILTRTSDGSMIKIAPSPLVESEEVFLRLRAAAGDAVVCIGYSEMNPDGGHPFASAVCISGDGVLGNQRKVHVPPGERGLFAAGDSFTAFDTPVGRLGMLLCYDKSFPEAARKLTLDGADAIACLSAWAMSSQAARRTRSDRLVRQFNAIDVTRAIENQVVWVSSNQVGLHGGLRFPGQSKVVDPHGRILASTGGRSGMAVARIDPVTATRAVRLEISHLEDRVPGAYPPMGDHGTPVPVDDHVGLGIEPPLAGPGIPIAATA